MDKPVTVRLPKEVIDKLMALAILDDNANLAAEIRCAIDEYIKGRLTDPELKVKVAAARTRQAEVLAELSEAAELVSY